MAVPCTTTQPKTRQEKLFPLQEEAACERMAHCHCHAILDGNGTLELVHGSARLGSAPKIGLAAWRLQDRRKSSPGQWKWEV